MKITNRTARRRTFALAAVVTAMTVTAGPVVGTQSASAVEPNCVWMDVSKTPTERANLLLDASSLEQQMRWLNEAAANEVNQNVFGTVTYPAQLPCVPFTADIDGPFGVAYTPGVTAFPVPVAQAASWNSDLAWERGQAIGDEAFRKRYNQLLGPGLDIVRHPWGGRNAEYLGEDPLLSGQLGGQWVNGLRDGTPAEPVAAVIKHFVGNNQEFDRANSSSNIDDRTIHQVYNLPFEIANATSKPAGVMCSYNQVNGIYACENPDLLTKNLREQIGFDGFVVTDNGAYNTTVASLKAGLDQELSLPVDFAPDNLNAAIAAGQITTEQVRAAAFRVVRAKIANGMFDNPLPAAAEADVRTAEHHALARKTAEQGSVLLKNSDQLLPLTSTGQTIAIIGPTASNTPTNGISAKTVCTAPLYGLPSAPTAVQCPDPVAPLDAITARAAEAGNTVIFSDGSDLDAAAQLAATADVVVVFGYNFGGEYFDLPDLSLAQDGDELIQAVSAANPNTAVILETVGPVLMPWVDSVKSVLEAWYPGEAQGDAIAALLFGDVSPSGKLPVTFPEAITDLPTGSAPNDRYPGVFSNGSTTRPEGSTEIRQVNYGEGLQVGYKWYDQQNIAPLFEFGHGLSYTSFSYSNLSVQTTASSAGEGYISTVSFNVTNTGMVSGAEVPQVYLTLPAETNEPGKRLVQFDRLELAPGQSQTVTLQVDSAAPNHPFSTWDVKSQSWRTADGSYVFSVGSSSRELPLQQAVSIDTTAPTAITAPTIDGDSSVGRTLTANSGTWSENDLDFSYQWLRDGTPIAEATTQQYRVSAADRGRIISVQVTAQPATGPAGIATSAGAPVRTFAVVLVSPIRLIGTTSTNFSVAAEVKPLTEGLVADGSVSIRIDGKTFTGTLTGNKVTIPIGTLGRGLHLVTATYSGNSLIRPAAGVSIIIVSR